MTLPELMFKHMALSDEVLRHNCAVMIRRRRGESWDAPENQYRNAITEALDLEAKRS